MVYIKLNQVEKLTPKGQRIVAEFSIKEKEKREYKIQCKFSHLYQYKHIRYTYYKMVYKKEKHKLYLNIQIWVRVSDFKASGNNTDLDSLFLCACLLAYVFQSLLISNFNIIQY